MSTCADCVWFEPRVAASNTLGYEPSREGKCRRNPPVMNADGWGFWVMVHADDWCGELTLKGEDSEQ